ncbi:nuclease-related domain-containing protein [Salirhabdus euzebyi]|nr:nuclease-related domain-containing protein [Salirhabdus euzebyi]
MEPIFVQKLRALLSRLPLNHPVREKVESDLGKRVAGYKGEQSLHYYLSFLPEKEFHILYDLRLSFNNHFFQIDVLLLSKRFFLILEVKNMAGTLLFDDRFNQVIRIKDGEEEPFQDPLQQVKHQQFQFLNWLKRKHIEPAPVEALVLIVNRNAILKTMDEKSKYVEKVLHSTMLLPKIDNFKKLYKDFHLTDKDIKKIKKLLLKNNTPYNPDVLQLYNLSKTDLLSGVRCPNCSYLPMDRVYGKWICRDCDTSAKGAHLNALLDYSLLCRSTISNQEVRSFLHISSPSVAQKLLQSLNTPQTGTTINRTYKLPLQHLYSLIKKSPC